ncbi:MAG TPA: metal ABC transporter substrate-binding protein, partial [Nitrososphaera sp.]|nr:metal ABC transporter substrate-binding protein [Nitrososphaera sp.]
MGRKIIVGIVAAAVAAAIALGIVSMSIQTPQPSTASDGTEKVKVIASFFPLYDFARNVGGDRADVSVMVPAGIEPHDWEPTPRNIADAENADLIIYNGAGFESWVSQVNAKNAVDTSKGIELMEGGEHEEGEAEGEEHGESGL